MKVLFCSSEAVPFAKTGGLADVSGALPPALAKAGCTVKVALPYYRCVKRQVRARRDLSGRDKIVKMDKNIEVYLINNDKYFDRAELYGTSGGDYPDNLERFAFFCKRILSLLPETGFQPEIIHCNDWQTALIPVYLKSGLAAENFFARTKSLLTIHNLAYQGLFPKNKFVYTGLNAGLFNPQALEFYGQVNLLKGGLVFCDLITTVGPTYAQEIQSPSLGCGLDGVLRQRSADLFGIINGLDYAVWDPAVDNQIFKRYSSEDVFKFKPFNKRSLQQELDLPCAGELPLLGIVTRLAQQKGIELLISTLEKIIHLEVQFVLLGTGDERYHQALKKIKLQVKKNVSINLRFDATLAHKIYAGCDIFLMPSFYEPCGLGQLISFKYGTVPIVRRTGGLADTVVDYDSAGERGNGFVFEKYTAAELLQAIRRAIAVYRNKQKWNRLIDKITKYDFSWAASAKKYIEVYRRALNKKEFDEEKNAK